MRRSMRQCPVSAAVVCSRRPIGRVVTSSRQLGRALSSPWERRPFRNELLHSSHNYASGAPRPSACRRLGFPIDVSSDGRTQKTAIGCRGGSFMRPTPRLHPLESAVFGLIIGLLALAPAASVEPRASICETPIRDEADIAAMKEDLRTEVISTRRSDVLL